MTAQQKQELQEALDRFYTEMDMTEQLRITNLDVQQAMVEETRRGHYVLFTSRKGEA